MCSYRSKAATVRESTRRKPCAWTSPDWQKLEFTLTPKASDNAGRFAIKLKEAGQVVVGYAFLQPGEWGRFHGLPVRKDVAEGLMNMGVTVLRYGGSMVNHIEYRWKNMIGPRDRRPFYHGTWYPYSTNGWGIIDFINMCEAMGIPGIPAFNMMETPQDMADFVEYVNGPPESAWGRKRAADGHPAPYRWKYIELGNEERIDDAYFARFQPMAEAIWARDADIILVVGDFVYGRPIQDPSHIEGAAARITNLDGHRKILELAKRHNREVWFDVHLGTDGPRPDATLAALPTYIDALEKIADGARHKVVVFELNAGNHAQRRALANAIAINTIARDGRVPIVCAANGLQPDGQNDNGWDQGLLFLNPEKVWLQPPGWVARMISRSYESRIVAAEANGAALDVTALRSDDGRTLVLRVVNVENEPRPARLIFEGFTPSKDTAQVEQLAAPLDAVNTARRPDQVAPRRTEWRHGCKDGAASYTFPPNSFTVLRFE